MWPILTYIQNQYKDVLRLDIDILLFGSDDLAEEDINMYISSIVHSFIKTSKILDKQD